MRYGLRLKKMGQLFFPPVKWQNMLKLKKSVVYTQKINDSVGFPKLLPKKPSVLV